MAERKLLLAVQGQSYGPMFDEKLTAAAWKTKPSLEKSESQPRISTRSDLVYRNGSAVGKPLVFLRRGFVVEFHVDGLVHVRNAKAFFLEGGDFVFVNET